MIRAESAKALLGLAFFVAGLIALPWLRYPTISFNYRLTIEAMTPDGPKQASSVIQGSYGSTFNLNGGGRRGVTSVTGEAVYLDLGRGKNLFVTLSSNGSGRQSSPGRLDGALDAIWLPIEVFDFKWNCELLPVSRTLS